ncbi:hypothetical protein ACFC3R_00170 [Enterococcus durans]
MAAEATSSYFSELNTSVPTSSIFDKSVNLKNQSVIFKSIDLFFYIDQGSLSWSLCFFDTRTRVELGGDHGILLSQSFLQTLLKNNKNSRIATLTR